MIKFLDLKAINVQYRDELLSAMAEVLDSGWYIFGEKMAKFEEEFKAYCGAREAIATGDGLDALKLIFRGYKEMGAMKDGDEVLIASNAYIATVLSILENGLKPVLVEPDINTFNINENFLEEKITDKTKAILALHLYGQVSYSEKMREIADKYNLKIVEDSAQACGAGYAGKKTGNLGDASGFSFFPSKTLGALGDAGMITTNDAGLAETIRSLRYYQDHEKPHHCFSVIKSRMDEMQAAVLSVKLKYLDGENKKRGEIAQEYLQGIKNEKLILPVIKDRAEHAWHLFVVKTRQRDELREYLAAKGIETFIHYKIPVHNQPAFPEWSKEEFSVSSELSKTILSLPLYPVMPEEHVKKVIEACNKY
jgi:dTDP-4-amino-4,6-dideoxygalactose transaminase